MLILVDMDGVLADFEGAFLRDWRQQYPDKPFISLDQRRTFYLLEDYPRELRSEVHGVYTALGFFRKLDPIPGAIEALHIMRALSHEVFICTSPLYDYENCVLEKFQWVEDHLGKAWTQRIVMSADKTVVYGDVLIDDKPLITGATQPQWEHIVYDQPYNRESESPRRLTWADDWKSIVFSKPALVGLV
jgi:5'-nucleotidase